MPLSVWNNLFGLGVHHCLQLHPRVMLLFLTGLFHLSTPTQPAGSATSPSLAQAEEPELHMAQCDLQCVIQRPEESKATQQQQELEEEAQDRGMKLPRIL